MSTLIYLGWWIKAYCLEWTAECGQFTFVNWLKDTIRNFQQFTKCNRQLKIVGSDNEGNVVTKMKTLVGVCQRIINIKSIWWEFNAFNLTLKPNCYHKINMLSMYLIVIILKLKMPGISAIYWYRMFNLKNLFSYLSEK